MTGSEEERAVSKNSAEVSANQEEKIGAPTRIGCATRGLGNRFHDHLSGAYHLLGLLLCPSRRREIPTTVQYHNLPERHVKKPMSQ